MYASTTASGSSHIRITPRSSQIAWSQSSRIDPRACETSTIVCACEHSSFILFADLRRKRASPTDSASSISRMSGSMLTATENASRPYMPEL